MDTVAPRFNRWFWILAAVLSTWIVWVYWPVAHARFIWFDKLDFLDRPWLREGDAWKHYVLHGFNNWTQYFRPLVVALFTVQVRLFDAQPGPMHLVSLALHLGNVLMIGLLARRVSGAAPRNAMVLGLVAMLLYGVHPLLVGPVAWIGCQFDLVATLLTLACLLANVGIRQVGWRAAAISVLFFLAAGAKESAIAIPPLVVLFDWMLYADRTRQGFVPAVRQVLRRNLPVYAGMVLAGCVYLFLRHWALGALINSNFITHGQTPWAHVREVSFLYLHYWGSLFVPGNTGPIHPVDVARFQAVSMAGVLTVLVAAGIFLAGAWMALRRASVIGCIVLAVTVCLLPVLHIVPVFFDDSLYHDRYAMTALAVACAMVMRVRLPLARVPALTPRRVTLGAAVMLLAWTASTALSIRVTLPLWANNLNLWRWAVAQYPDSSPATYNLLSTYLNRRDYAAAENLVQKIRREGLHCPRCLIGEATLEIARGDYDAASRALQNLRNARELAHDRELYRSYLVTTGQLLNGQGKYRDAEGVLREAVRIDPQDANPRIVLAFALAGQGRMPAAQDMARQAVALLPREQRRRRLQRLQEALKSGAGQAGRPASRIMPAPVSGAAGRTQ